jgi:quinol monooxygenase YgiN
MSARQASAQLMTIRASVRISMAPSPILVGRRFRPRFSEARAIFLVAVMRCRAGAAGVQCVIRVFSDFSRQRGAGMAEIAVVALIVAKPGAEEKLRVQLEGIVEPTRNEAGALQYDLHRDLKEPARFVFVERWASEEALAAHARSAHILAYREAAADWIERSEIRVLSKLV